MAIRKQKEYDIAYLYYTKEGMTAKDIAKKIGVSENTLSGKKGWINKYNWRKLRDASFSTQKKTLEQLEDLHSILVERRLQQERENKDIDKALIFEIRTLSKEIDKYTKDKASLTTYIDITDEFVAYLQNIDKELSVNIASYASTFIQNKVK